MHDENKKAERKERLANGKEKLAKSKERVTAVKKEIKQKVAQKVKPNTPNKVSTNRLKLLVTVVARNKAEYYTDVIQGFEVNMQMISLARGTASSQMLGLLGLTDNEKAVIIAVIQEDKISQAMQTLENKFNTIKDGKGIAFTIPLTSVIGTLIYGFLSNNKLTVKESK